MILTMKKILSITIFVLFSLCALAQPTAAVLSVAGSASICAGGSSSLKVDIIGGTSPYKVVYLEGANSKTVKNYISGDLIPITPSLTANYSLVSVEDDSMKVATGLSGMPMVTVNANPTVSIASSHGLALSCSIPNTTLTASTGSSYSWSDGSTNAALKVSKAGVYTVTVTAANGCTNKETVTVTESKDSPDVSIAPSDPNLTLTCGVISISLTASSAVPNVTYKWNDTSNSTTSKLDITTKATYTVTVTNPANGCTKSESKEIKENKKAPNTPTGEDKTINCTNNKQVTLNGKSTTPDVSYLWTNNQITDKITVTEDGSFKVTITDNVNKCTSSATFNVKKDTTAPIVTIKSNNGLALSCKTLSTTLTASGGASYFWKNASTLDKIEVKAAGTYAVTVTGSNGCTSVKEETVTGKNKADFSIKIEQTAQNLCKGDAQARLKAIVEGGTAPSYQYLWDKGGDKTSQENSSLSEGIYNVTVTDAQYLCTVSDKKIIGDPSKLTLSMVPIKPKCNGDSNGSITLNGSGGTGEHLFSINNDSNFLSNSIFNNLKAGGYTFWIKDANGCKESMGFKLEEPAKLIVTATSKAIGGNGFTDGSVSASVSGGTSPYKYKWLNEKNESQGTNATKENLGVGTYFVTVTDDKGCTATSKTTISPFGCKLKILKATITHVKCPKGMDGKIDQIIIIGQDNSKVNFEWKTPANLPLSDTTFLNAVAGTYQLHISTNQGCAYDTSFNIIDPPLFEIKTTTTKKISCYESKDGELTIVAKGATPNYTYYLGTTEQKDSVFKKLSVGTYNIYLKDSRGCESPKTTVTIGQPNPISIEKDKINSRDSITDCTKINGQISVIAQGGNTPYSYKWTNSSVSESVLSNLDKGTYTVTVTDINGCTSSKSFDIINNNRVPKELKIYLKPSGDILFVNSKDTSLTKICLFWQKDGKDIPNEEKLWIYIGKDDHTKYSLKQVFKDPTKIPACNPINKCQTISKAIIKLVNNDDIVEAIGFEVFPNPNNGLFSLRLTDLLEDTYQLHISNMQGQELKQIQISAAQQEVEVEGLPSGVYLLRLVDKQGHVGTKLIVIHE
jgi:hypothetical protein